MFHDHILVIDTETGGLDPQEHSILSVGVSSWCGQHTQEWFILEETLSTNPRSMEVNGIDLNWLQTHGLSPRDTCKRIDLFLELLPQRPLIFAGHNISFDLAFMKRLYRLAHRPFPSAFSHRSIDTHSLLWLLAQQGHIPMSACTSDGAFAYFEIMIPEEQRHTALADAIATRKLLKKILARFQQLAPLHSPHT